MAALPKDHREVILLRSMEGLPLSDVAQRMGRSVEGVRYLWVQALAALHEKLATILGEEP